MRGFLGASLRRAGHVVSVAEDGIHALAELQDEDTSYDMLVTDIAMPGMDGMELAKRAADMRPALKVVFIAGFSAVSLMKEAANPYPQAAQTRRLSRPFHLRQIAQEVDMLLAA